VKILNLPNTITIGRLLIAPAVVWLISAKCFDWAFGLFIVASLSDGLDGAIARLCNARTKLGAFLDPLADKALLVGTYGVLGYGGHLPSWLVIMVIFRDIIIIGGALVFHVLTGTLEMKPLLVSKINTFAQIGLAVASLAHLSGILVLDPYQYLMIWAVALTTVISGAVYVIKWSLLASNGGGANHHA
jgi:cardiolipin synthase